MPREIFTEEETRELLKLIDELDPILCKKQPDYVLNVYEKHGDIKIGKPFENTFVADRALDIQRELGYKGLYRLNVYEKPTATQGD